MAFKYLIILSTNLLLLINHFYHIVIFSRSSVHSCTRHLSFNLLLSAMLYMAFNYPVIFSTNLLLLIDHFVTLPFSHTHPFTPALNIYLLAYNQVRRS